MKIIIESLMRSSCWKESSKLSAVSLMVAFVLCGALRYAYIHKPYYHPDEQIAVKIVQGLAQQRTLDTNFANFELSNIFNHDLYNFSSYHLFLYALSSLAEESNLQFFRYCSATLATVAIFILFKLLLLFTDRVGAIAGVYFYALLPTLVQEAHYARAESFLLLLTLLVLLLFISNNLRNSILGFFLLGVGVSCKVSAGSLLFSGIVLIVSLSAIPLAILAVLLGMFIGAPYSFLNIEGYLNGLNTLATQYSSPNSPIAMSHISMYFRILIYYLDTLGLPALLICIIGVFISSRIKLRETIALILPLLLTIVVFGNQESFYARNLSHLLPVTIIFFGVGVSTIVRIFPKWRFVFLLVMVLGIWRPSQISAVLVKDIYSARFNMERVGMRQRLLREHPGALLIECQPYHACDLAVGFSTERQLIFELEDYGDARAKNISSILSSLPGTGRLDSLESPFPRMSPTTLNVRDGPRLEYYLVPPLQNLIERAELLIAKGGWKMAGDFRLKNTYPPEGARQSNYSFGTAVGESGELHSDVFEVSAGKSLLLFVMVGPVSTRQEFGMDYDFDGKIDSKIDLDLPFHVWIPIFLEPSARGRLVALDRGEKWGEWIGVAEPMLIDSF